MWRDAQARERERLWPVVERFLSGLPPRLFEQAKVLEYDLALRYSSSGQFRDIFLGADQFPALSIASWLLDDLTLAVGARRERAERHLFLAAVLLAARSQTIAAVLDASSFYDAEHLALVQLLSDRSSIELARVVPPSSSFWEMREAIALDGLETMLGESQRRRDPQGVPDEPETYLAPRWSAPGRLIALATLEVGRRHEIAPPVDAMLEAVAAAFEIKASLASMHADLLQGRPTYPIAVVARAAGLSLQPWPEPTLVLGALVATGTLGSIVEGALERVREGRRLATELGLGTFAGYLADVQAGFEASRPAIPSRDIRVTPGTSGGTVPSRPPAPLVTVARPTQVKALAMAEGCLLSDPTYRESWELHREGMFGVPAVASRFPAGLILEILCAHGHDLAAQVDAFLDFTAANGFRYFDHPWSGVDSDTIGVFLRLIRRATPGSGHGEAARVVLACLEREVATSGRVPVWIAGCDDSPAGRPPILDLGEGCGTVAAHLLLGLLGYDPARYAETIVRGSIGLLDRIVDVGLGANVNYPRAYALAAFGRLIARLQDPTLGPDLGGDARRAAAKARRVLVDELDREIAWRVPTAQQAALLTIAGLDLGHPDRLDPRWTTTILKAQRFDGSWPGEPFAAAPNRGLAVTWYSSTLLTSALCYDALMRVG